MKINRDQLIVVLKEKYDYEIQRKLYYETILNIPVTLLGLLSAGLFYLLNTTDLNSRIWYITIKLPLIGLIVLCGCIAVYFVFGVLFGYKREYKSFPNSDEVKRNFDQAVQYHTKIAKIPESKLIQYLTKEARQNEINDLVNELFRDFIVKWYVEINVNNSSVNDKRGNSLYWAKMFIGISFLGIIIVFFLSIISKI
jgi:hypothetical protein